MIYDFNYGGKLILDYTTLKSFSPIVADLISIHISYGYSNIKTSQEAHP